MTLTLLELQDILGKRVKLAEASVTMDEETRNLESEASELITRLAKQMINSADVMLRRDKARAEGKLINAAIDQVVGGYES